MKRKILTLSSLALICSVSVACSGNNTSNNNTNTNDSNIKQENNTSQANINNDNTTHKITIEKAKEIALNHAKLSENDVIFIKSKIDYDDGIAYYDIEFYSNNKEYDYKIDANSGSIREYDFDIENYSIPQANNNVNANTNSTNNNLNTNNNVSITDVKAKDIALKHANLSENQVQALNAHLDYDDGKQVYDVDFYANNREHSYKIDAQTGNIISYDVDSMHD